MKITHQLLLAACLAAGVAAPAVTVSQPALAADTPKAKDDAEAARLADEIQKLAAKEQWKGVDLAYKLLTKLKDVKFAAHIHVTAAVASRSFGDIASYIERLQLAKAAGFTDPKRPLDEWRKHIETFYGKVDISKQKKGERDLKRDEEVAQAAEKAAQEDPLWKASIAFANDQIADNGKFEGWLPRGKYHLSDKMFVVVPGNIVSIKR